jgi:hypothetical protein
MQFQGKVVALKGDDLVVAGSNGSTWGIQPKDWLTGFKTKRRKVVAGNSKVGTQRILKEALIKSSTRIVLASNG